MSDTLPMDDSTRSAIRQAGKWEQFQERRKELKANGMSAFDAWQTAAREALSVESGKDESPAAIPFLAPGGKGKRGGDEFRLEAFGEDWEPDTVEAIRFVSCSLHAEDVQPEDAPSPQAANLLIWARRNASNENKFWEIIFPKLVSKSELEQGGRASASAAEIHAALEAFESSLAERGFVLEGPEGSSGESGVPASDS